jgi:hypothetical protein
MRSQDVRRSIRRSWTVIEELGLAETFSYEMPLPVNDEFRDLALDLETRYEDLYLAGLRMSHYNFSLVDFSYFQFSITADDHVRYVYYPNPFIKSVEQDLGNIIDLRSLVANGEVDDEEFLTILEPSERPELRIPVIRYENGPEQYRAFHHPCSHFHIGFQAENRWPANRVLTPVAFTLLIMKYYYGSFWRDLGADGTDPFGNRYESSLAREKTECALVDQALFSNAEARGFYFS